MIFDCDDTLTKDTTAWLFEKCGVDYHEIYKESARLINDGWDPPLAYMSIILKKSEEGQELSNFRLNNIKEWACNPSDLFYPGTEDLFDRLRAAVISQESYKEIGITVNFYIISGGIEEFMKETAVGKSADAVWASSFEYNDQGKPIAIKNSISFTEKTRYLFCINKGVEPQARSSPYIVNSPEPEREKRVVPFRNMIYIGDGPSDIPCMSVVSQYGGTVIGILCEKVNRVWEVGFGRRANFTIPQDYREDQIGYKSLKSAVMKIAEKIRTRRDYEFPPFGGF